MYRPTAKQRYANWLKCWQESDRSRHVREWTPAHSVQSTSAVEATIGQVRTVRAHLEPMLDVVVRPNMCIWPWVTRAASCLMSRLSTRASGRIATEEAFDRGWKEDLCVLGESILFWEAERKKNRSAGEGTEAARSQRRAASRVVACSCRADRTNMCWERNVVSSSREVFAGLRNSAVTNIWSVHRKECLGKHAKDPRWRDPAESSRVSRYLFRGQTNIPTKGPVQRHLWREEKVSASSSSSAAQDSPDTLQILPAVPSEPPDTSESRPVTNTSAACSDPDAMESHVSKPFRLVDESLDETTPARAKKARLAVRSAGQNDSRPTVDEDMPTGYQDGHFEAVVYDIGENVRDKHRWEKFKLSGSLTLLGLSTLLHLKGSKCYRPVLWTTLGTRALSPWTTDEYHAQATTMATNRLIDVVATRRKDSLLE